MFPRIDAKNIDREVQPKRSSFSGKMEVENTVSSSSELNHLFIADSLQLTSLTSRFGGEASFATSISLEKLDRSLSSFLPIFFASILGELGSQPALFCRYSTYKKQYKGRLKAFFLTKYTELKLQSFLADFFVSDRLESFIT